MVLKYSDEPRKESMMSYGFSDSTDNNLEAAFPKKNTLDSGKPPSSEESKGDFEKKMNANLQPHKNSNATHGFSAQSYYKEDSSILEFRDPADRTPRERKLTAISQLTATPEQKETQSQLIGTKKGAFAFTSEDYIAGLRHDAGQDLADSKYRITALTYGTSGLLNFMDTLFTQLAARKQVHKQFNYYFALKKQLEEMEDLNHEKLLDYAESPVPILFCISPLVRTFDDFEELIASSGFGNMAVCDIDGSFSNDIQFKEMEEEKAYIRAIMGLKNHQISQFDNAFPDQN